MRPGSAKPCNRRQPKLPWLGVLTKNTPSANRAMIDAQGECLRITRPVGVTLDHRILHSDEGHPGPRQCGPPACPAVTQAGSGVGSTANNDWPFPEARQRLISFSAWIFAKLVRIGRGH